MNEMIENRPRRSALRMTGLLCMAAAYMSATALAAVSAEPAATDKLMPNGPSATGDRGRVKIAIQPSPDLLLEIRTIAAATDEQALSDGLARIRRVVGNAHDRLVPQLLLFMSEQEGGIEKNGVVALILKRLNVPREAAVSALVPHLDNDDAAIRTTVRALLRGYENRSATRPPNFSTYRAIIETAVRAGDEPSNALIRFMYATDPGTALLATMRGYQLRDPDDIKPILWGEHLVAEMLWKRRYGFIRPTEVEPEAVRQLESLSRHARWWVRLYTAEICRRHTELCSPEIRERLATDTHTLVRAAILTAEPTLPQK